MASLARAPRLSGLPLVGHFLEFRRHRLALLERAATECGDLARLDMFGIPVVMVSAAALAREVLVDRVESFGKSLGLRGYKNPLLGDGLITSGQELHRRQRRLMSPAFRPARIARYAEVMSAHGEKLVASWQDGQIIDVAQEMMRVTLGIAAKTLFDTDVEAEADEIGRAFSIANRFVTQEANALLRVPAFVPTRRNLAVRRAVRRLDEIVFRIVDEHRRSNEDRGDLLSMLLAARDEQGRPMPDSQVRDEAMTIFLAGHETTANALTWTFDLLSRAPDVSRRLRDEVDRVLADRPPTLGDLAHLPYTLAVLKESMRLRPPAYVMTRTAGSGAEVGGYEVPAGTYVFINVFGMHRRADYFPEPLRFAPERFLPEREKHTPRDAYLPFGAGPRVCIGNHFSLMEAQLLLAQIVQAFELVPTRSTPAVPDPVITLRVRGGLPVRLLRRSLRLAA